MKLPWLQLFGDESKGKTDELGRNEWVYRSRLARPMPDLEGAQEQETTIDQATADTTDDTTHNTQRRDSQTKQPPDLSNLARRMQFRAFRRTSRACVPASTTGREEEKAWQDENTDTQRDKGRRGRRGRLGLASAAQDPKRKWPSDPRGGPPPCGQPSDQSLAGSCPGAPAPETRFDAPLGVLSPFCPFSSAL